jgi:predicted RNase H-like nuclease (RuvC/YqgF family)
MDPEKLIISYLENLDRKIDTLGSDLRSSLDGLRLEVSERCERRYEDTNHQIDKLNSRLSEQDKNMEVIKTKAGIISVIISLLIANLPLILQVLT